MVKLLKEVTTDRSLPHSVETERSILGAILIDNTTLHQALEVLSRDDFYQEAHRRIFEKMIALFEKDRPIDPVTLREELERSGELEQIGGVSYVAGLMDGTPYLRNIEHYAKIVRDKSLLRRLIITSNQIISECFEQEDESEIILDKAERAILDIADDRTKVGFAPVAEVAKRQLELVEQLAGRPQTITGLATGFLEFDQMTSGLQPSDLIIVAARPSVGKTSFALSIAQNAAQAGHTIGISSLEMSKEQLVIRLLCSEARINMHRFRGGFLNRDEWGRLAEGLRRLAECRIFIDDTPGITTLELRAKARRLKHERKLDLLIIDYLQLMSGRGRTDSRQQEVSQISRELKGLAKDLNVPVIAVSQLSRAPESRTDHRPQLSDLRESGCLAGDSLVTLADSGREIPIRELVGQSGFAVWALNEETLKIERAIVSRAFSTGVKPVYRLTTRLGRTIRATANHKFRTFGGWKRLDELEVGERLALPRWLPSSASQSISDVYWNQVISIEPDGETDVYDLTVERHHNFVANNIYLHNSIEQDADVVAFLFREEMYNRTPENEGKAELILTKQRNGPTGTIELAFLREFTRFENLMENPL